jgi:penicillin-binding protein 2
MYRNRLKIILIIIALGAAALVGRLAQLQLLQHARYARDAYGRRVHMEVTTAPRGRIYDCAGNVLAEDRPAYDIAIVPLRTCARDERTEAAAIETLAKAASLPPDEIRYRIYGDDGVAARLAGNLERQLRWLIKKEILKISADDAASIAQSVRNCASLAEARTQIRDRFGRKCLDVFDRAASEPFVIMQDVDVATRDAVAIAATEESGIRIVSSSTRYYPFGASACHIIGYLSQLSPEEYRKKEEAGYFSRRLAEIIGESRYESLERANYFASQKFGVTGMEAALDAVMRPSTGAALVVLARGGDETVASQNASPGADVTLTIDMNVQRAAEEALGERRGAVVVMDVNTGEILALASWPRYDLNTVRANYAALSADPEHPLFPGATQGLYPPGSSFKVIEAVAAVHEFEGYENVTYPCHGSIMVGSMEKFCRNHAGTDAMSFRDALKKSCNIFFYRTATKLGGERLADWAGRFGIGKRTGIEVGDAAGRIDAPQSAGETWNTAIGQGTLIVTPLQMARVIAAIANGGKLVTPHLVLKPARDYSVVDMGLNPDKLRIVREALWAVVNEHGGTAYDYARMKTIEAAGKTGTAETPEKDRNDCWFIGWAPYDKPKICVVVIIEKAPDNGHGGKTAGPVALDVFRAYFGQE